MSRNILKQLVTLLLIVLVLPIATERLSAKEVSPEQALKRAQEFLQGASTTRNGALNLKMAMDSRDIVTTTRANEYPTFYLFTNQGDGGFVIVSADDSVSPIIGYSTTEVIDINGNMPDNLRAWFEFADGAIAYSRKQALGTHHEWDTPRPLSDEGKHLKTALWSQDAPYNLYCPMDGENRSLTGCTSTATGIIMHYHKWPESAWGTTSEYVTNTQQITVPPRDINHTYDWDNMRFSYKEGYNDVEADAVATLLSDIGYCFQADYGSAGTGALPNIEWLIDHFSYGAGTQYCYRQTITKDGWNALIRNEIDNNRPVLYSGFEKDGSYGHAFVVDGYDSHNFFHLNWGWAGGANGYFLLEDLRPEGYDFSYDQWVLLGFEPARDTSDFPNWITTFDIAADRNEFDLNTPFTITSLGIINQTPRAFNGFLRLAHTDAEGTIKSWISDEFSATIEAQFPYIVYFYDIECTITESIVYGDRIRLFYTTNGDEWNISAPYSYSAKAWEIALQSTLPSIDESTALTFNKTTGELVISHDHRVTVTVSLAGTGIGISGVSYEITRTLIDTKQLEGKTILVHLVSESEERKFTLNIEKLINE